MRTLRAIAAMVAAMTLIPALADAASVGVCGGGGGSQSTTLSCPAGQYIVSVFARGGSYVDNIGVRCASFNSSGVRGTPGAFQYAGGTGGDNSQSGTCNGNRAVDAIFTRAGSYLDRARSAACAIRQPQGGFQVQSVSDKQFFLLDVGGGGGGSCSLRCPNGEAMHKLIVRYGSWIDSIQAFCRP